MANKKTIKKIPTLLVDLTEAKSSFDVYCAVANAKCDKHLTQDEFDAIVEDIADKFVPTIFICNECCEHVEEKKPNVFKRFWNWITRKK